MASGFAYTLEDIKIYVKEYGFDYVDGYITSGKPMTIQDSDGYLYYASYQVLKQGVQPNKFSAKNPHTIHNINRWIIINEYDKLVELVDTEYKSATEKLLWKCKQCNSTFQRNWHTMHKDVTHKTCQLCNKKAGIHKQKKLDTEKDFNQYGYEVIGHYDGTHRKITLIDQEKYLYYTSHNIFFENNKQPYVFSKFNPYTIYNINQWILNNNVPVKLISEEFIGGDVPLEWECECGNHFMDLCCNVLKGNKRYQRFRCEECSGKQSSISIKTEQYLQKLNVSYIKEYRIDGCKDKAHLPFDFAVIKDNTVKGLIEVDGGQHYHATSFKKNYSSQDKIDSLKYIQHHDNIKNIYCLERNIPLLRIPYWEFNKDHNYELLIDNFIYNIINV